MKKVSDFYPITTITYPDGSTSGPLVLNDHLIRWTAPVRLPSLEHAMEGQTCTLDGVYADDVERWLNGKVTND